MFSYREPIRDYRWHRFEPSGRGAYTEVETNIWQAIGQFEAGFHPSFDSHPPSDFPELHILNLLNALDVYHDQDWIDHVTEGLWLAVGTETPDGEKINDWPDEQQAAYFARKGISADAFTTLSDHTQELINLIKTIWEKWQQMKGDNDPLVRSYAGERRDFDINLDGMAHYGMLPDLLQDIRNIGLSAEDFNPLFRSAYDYIQMWDTCEQRASELRVKEETE